jgi:Cell division protein FtsI/penicillin-binding protein 2
MSILKNKFGKKFKKRNTEINPEDIFLDSKNISNFNINHEEGTLEKTLSPKVFYILITIFSLIFMIILIKLYTLQIIYGKENFEISEKNRLREKPIFAQRGIIKDRNNNFLAWNETITENTSTSTKEAEINTELNTKQNLYKRVYISEPGFSHILGYVSYPQKDKNGIYWQNNYIGIDGVEKFYQNTLSGINGYDIIEISANKKNTDLNIRKEPIDGENLILTIDKDLQSKLFNEIKILADKAGFQGGAGIIMDVINGEILAMTSYPEYNNNLIFNQDEMNRKNKTEKKSNNIQNQFLNKNISGLYTPGSTIKPIIALAALEEKIIDPNKHIYSSGALVIKNKYGGPDTIFRDWKKHGLYRYARSYFCFIR